MSETATESRRSALITWTTGDRDAPPVMLLHDRYLDHDAMDAFAAPLAAGHRVVSARSARTQQENTVIKGYYWFLGRYDKPEPSTFGDGLHHLERLLLTLSESGRRVGIVGSGEGGTMALVLALVWRELVASVVSIDGPLPVNLDDLPLQLEPAAGLPVLLVETTRPLAATATALAARGATVDHRPLATTPVPAVTDWLTHHPATPIDA